MNPELLLTANVQNISDRPSYAPDEISLDRIHFIENDMLMALQTLDLFQVSMQIRVRHNRPYIDIPKGKLDASPEVDYIISLITIASQFHEDDLVLHDSLLSGISYYHVDEFQRLQNLKRIFMSAQDANFYYAINITKDNNSMMINLTRNNRRMWMANVQQFRYQRGDYKDMILKVPSSPVIDI
jgi:hypothetical protein